MTIGPVTPDGKVIAAVIAAVDAYLSGDYYSETTTKQVGMKRWKLSSINGAYQFTRPQNWKGLDKRASRIIHPYNKF